jgi:hippurate hydrolase
MNQLTEEEYRIILDIKRDLHMHPELSNEEHRTTGIIKDFLKKLPGVELPDLPLKTGVIARIRGNAPGPETLLRADIDALPQNEQYESPWKSLNQGVMHACGHDFHTASLLGCAMILSRAAEAGELKGCADLLFQPAEEGTTGARQVIDAGLFEVIHPDRCFGIHNWPSVPAGSIVIHTGALMAAKRNFTIRVIGAGGHGSMPHLNIDPIVCAAALIQSLQTVVSRNMNPLTPTVLSVNMIHGGSPVNLVVNEVEIRATVRSLSEEALDRAIGRVETILMKTAEAYECRAEIKWDERIPAVINTPEMCSLASRAAEAVSGAEITDVSPSLASEDFALYRKYVPSFFYWVGSHKEGDPVEELHRPCFHTDDSAMRIAASLYAASALQAPFSY